MSWITHRAPTKEDADKNGFVIVPNMVRPGCWAVSQWDEVSKAQPFAPYPESDPGQSEEPETKARKFKQITSHRDGALATAIDVDDNAWYLISGQWHQYPPLPNRES